MEIVMLLNPGLKIPQQVRFHCREARCGTALKVPTDNSRDVCCKGCERQFYRRHCRVCEALFSPKTERRQVCSRAACRYQFKTNPEQFYSARYPHKAVAHNASRSAQSTGFKSDDKSGRPLRVITGPANLDPINLRPLPANAAALQSGRLASTIFKRNTPPFNVVGGHRFAAAPAVSLSGRARGAEPRRGHAMNRPRRPDAGHSKEERSMEIRRNNSPGKWPVICTACGERRPAAGFSYYWAYPEPLPDGTVSACMATDPLCEMCVATLPGHIDRREHNK
jgi:hypothetical protein